MSTSLGKRPLELVSTLDRYAGSGSEPEDHKLPVTKAVRKPRMQQPKQSKQPKLLMQPKLNITITAWDAVTTIYSAEVSSFFPSLASIPASLPIVRYLASLPAIQGALEHEDQRLGPRPFTLELGSKGSIKSQDKYDHFHYRNRNSRAQGNLKAALAQASGTPAPVPCSRCAKNRTLWKTCMKAAIMPGLTKFDTLNGACPGCYYNGIGHGCSNREPISMMDVTRSAFSHVADGESSKQGTQTSQTATESSVGSASKSGQQLQTMPHTRLFNFQLIRDYNQNPNIGSRETQDAVKIEMLLVQNNMLQMQVDRLQDTVDELEDMIEAEEQQSRI